MDAMGVELGGLEAIRPSLWAATALWSLGLMWGLSPLHRRLQEGWEKQLVWDPSGALASLLSVLPFLLAAAVVVALTELSLGNSWAVSWGLIACVGGGLYELGRRDNAR